MARGLFVNLQIYFIPRPRCCNFEDVLVISDLFTGWTPVLVKMKQLLQKQIAERSHSRV